MTLALIACGASCGGWIAAIGWRARAPWLAARGLGGGIAAFSAAWGAYLLLERAGMTVSWQEVLRGGSGGLAVAATIGLVEESAKLLGMALALLGARRVDAAGAAHTVLAVSAAFAALECAAVLPEADIRLLALRALLGPVAHAALSAPLGLVLVGGRRGLGWTVPALLLAALLHGTADLSLAVPGLGRPVYAAVLAAPAMTLHLWTRLAWARPDRAG
jgi:RsiW-degrading membrane proteinase PrsW (M82 family)